MLELGCQHFVRRWSSIFSLFLTVLKMFALGINKRSHEFESVI